MTTYNKEEYKELFFLGRVLGAFLLLVGINFMLKLFQEYYEVCSCIASQINFIVMGVLASGMSFIYYQKMKPKLNQLLVFVSCIFTCLATLVFFTYNLPYKLLMAGISLPMVLVLCGMWIYMKFIHDEID